MISIFWDILLQNCCIIWRKWITVSMICILQEFKGGIYVRKFWNYQRRHWRLSIGHDQIAIRRFIGSFSAWSMQWRIKRFGEFYSRFVSKFVKISLKECRGSRKVRDPRQNFCPIKITRFFWIISSSIRHPSSSLKTASWPVCEHIFQDHSRSFRENLVYGKDWTVTRTKQCPAEFFL
jgi:hypothetical protein